ANAHYDALSQLGYDATLVHYRLKTHEYSSIYDTLPRIFDHFARHRRVRNPGIVTWTRPPAEEDVAALGQVHDGAYWLSGVDSGTVTVRSHAIAHQVSDPAAAVRTEGDVDEGGPSGRTSAGLRVTKPDPGRSTLRGNSLWVTTRDASRLTVDLRAARLSADELFLGFFDLTGTVHLTLRGVPRGRYLVWVEGRSKPVKVTDGRIVVTVREGQQVALVQRR
ncbi:MAG TPA: hypothetical protein VNA12_06260, partial [Mycobacteriales bacterium]|nr:hypothetical protein [Mycobacteriales bacterium]